MRDNGDRGNSFLSCYNCEITFSKIIKMSDLKQIPYILKLLDDPSPITRKAILHELSSFGSNLMDVLDTVEPKITDAEKRRLQEFLAKFFVPEKHGQWMDWMEEVDDTLRLEKAIVYMASYQNEFNLQLDIVSELDALKEEFISAGYGVNIFELAKFLFEEQGFGGNRKDFYNPKNNDISYVIKHKKGLPISLVIIYMLVGRRLGLDIEGFNYPGHFMARAKYDEKWYLIDCYHAGESFLEKEFLKVNMSGNPNTNKNLFRTNAKIIVGRMLRNLARSYEIAGDKNRSRQMVDYLKELGK